MNRHALATALSAIASAASDGDWMLVFPAGSTKARDGRGPFTAGGKAEIEALIERTAAYHSGVDIMVDYDHQGHAVAEGLGVNAKAAGWIKELQARPDGLWARVEWTEAARAAIKAGEYRYLSPLFTADDKNRVDVLLNVALVNMPAFDLAAHAASTKGEVQVDFLKKAAKALGLEESASEEAVLAKIAANAKPEAIAAAALKPVALAAGLAETATAEQIAAAFKARGDSDAVVTALKAELAATAGRLATIEKASATEKATALVDGAIREGRVGVKPLRDHYVARASASAEGFASVQTELAALPALGGSVIPAAQPGEKATALSAEQAQAAKLLGIPADKYLETLNKERAA